MAEHIYRCGSCRKYTLEQSCPSCGSPTVLARPPKFSLEDKYGNYRREVRKKELVQEGKL